MWPVLGALATTYLLRRSQSPAPAGRRLFAMAGSRKSGMSSLAGMGSSIAGMGKAVLQTAMRAVQRR